MNLLLRIAKRARLLLASIPETMRVKFYLWRARASGKTSLLINLSSVPLHFNFVKDLIYRLNNAPKFLVIIACDFDRKQMVLPQSLKVVLSRFIPFLNVDHVITLDAGETPIHRRSKLIHIPHSLASMHVIYPEGAFDHFDYIFCAGPHHLRELTQMLRKREIRNCTLIPAGYEIVDRWMSHTTTNTNTPPVILFAPSWGEFNALALKGIEIITALVDEYEVILRPHGMSLVEDAKTLDIIRQRFGDHPRFSFDLSADSSPSARRADLLISDWSGIAFEYALAFLKPVVFIDGLMKVFNPNWNRYLPEPGIEKTEREKIGVVVQDMETLRSVVIDLLSTADSWKEKIRSARETLLFHPTRCAEATHHALSLLAAHQRGQDWVNV